MFKQGEIISVKWYFGVQHDGIHTAYGTVISASARTGEVTEEDINTFSDGKKVVSKGYPSTLPPETIEQNARAKLGKTYNLLSYNCQHFASECHGHKKSRQLRSVALTAAALALTIAVARAKRRA
jgi:hypothetical protein